jgi:hypothetical protein
MTFSKYLLASAISLTLLISGCKSRHEKRGDDFLKEGKIKNALLSYTKAEKDGKVSKEFNDNFARAYTQMMGQITKKEPTADVLRIYREEIPKRLENTKDTEAVAEFVKQLCVTGKALIDLEDMTYVMEGFKSFKLAAEWSKKHNTAQADYKKAFSEVETIYSKKILEEAASAENSVAAEYSLLVGRFILPENEAIQTELDNIRVKNRSHFLIFQAAGIDNPSPNIDVNAYIIAFPALKIGGGSAAGELQVWNSSGNNFEFSGADFKLVGKDGTELAGKQTGVATCTSVELDPKTFQNKTEKFAVGKNAKLIVEGQCSLGMSWSYPSGFEPEYIMLKNEFGTGKKFLGKV